MYVLPFNYLITDNKNKILHFFYSIYRADPCKCQFIVANNIFCSVKWPFKLWMKIINEIEQYNSCIMYLLYKLKPKDATLSFIWTGFYCPSVGFTPVPCPKGTYGPTVATVSADSCLQCPPHHYCPEPGLLAPKACGPVAHQPLSGQESCTCLREGQNFQVCFEWVSVITLIVDTLCLWLLHWVSCRNMYI